MRGFRYLLGLSAAMLLGGWLLLAQLSGPPVACTPAPHSAVCAPTTTSRPAVGQQVWQEAHRILGNIRTTRYQYSTQVNEADGLYALDCSGLACVILRKVAPRQLEQVAIEPGRKRQRAWMFYECFARASRERVPGWQGVPKMLDARAGDLLARRRAEIVPGQVSGHVMVIDAPPVLERPGLVRVVVIDSTSQPHADDTRPRGTSGVGRGTIWVQIDDDGRPVGWRTAPDAATTLAPFAIGRAVEEN